MFRILIKALLLSVLISIEGKMSVTLLEKHEN